MFSCVNNNLDTIKKYVFYLLYIVKIVHHLEFTTKLKWVNSENRPNQEVTNNNVLKDSYIRLRYVEINYK